MKTLLHFLLVMLGLGLAHARTWTSTDGKTIEGEFVRLEANAIVVSRGGQNLSLPLNRLVPADVEWAKAQSARAPTPAAPAAAIDAKRVGEILTQALKAEPSDADRQLVVDFFKAQMPAKGAKGEDVEWKVEFPRSGSDARTEILLTADLFPRGKTGSDDRLMWFHLVFSEKPNEIMGMFKVGRYKAVGGGGNLFVMVNRVDVRGVADAETYRDSKLLEKLLESINLRAISDI